MIIGDASVLAIQSGITEAYERLSQRALGFFVLRVGGAQYGVHEPNATMLANSFDEVQRRIALRGCHAAPFATQPNAGNIADAYLNSIYA